MRRSTLDVCLGGQRFCLSGSREAKESLEMTAFGSLPSLSYERGGAPPAPPAFLLSGVGVWGLGFGFRVQGLGFGFRV